jgi:chitinase
MTRIHDPSRLPGFRHRAPSAAVLAAILAVGAIAACAPAASPQTSPAATPTNAATHAPPATRTSAPYVSPRDEPIQVPPPRIVGYFTSWGLYARNYHVKTIVTSGSAEKLSVINYAFAGPFDGRCILADPQADLHRIYGRADSVNGQGNGPDAVRGHFGQLMHLKEMVPGLKVLLSIGGWTLSADFSDAALPENRRAFVASCVDTFIRGDLPGLEPGAGAGLFDGLDIDWEYPAAPGRRGNTYRPEDTANFTALLAEFRHQLDEIDPDLLLTIAAPAGRDRYSLMELDRIHPYLDWINVMAYDYHGTWEPTGPTNFPAALFTSPEDPAADLGLSADASIRAYLQAGVPPAKLNLGVPFYGRGWTGVADVENGLYQAAEAPASGLFEAGVNDYGVLQRLESPAFRDPRAGAYWLFDGETFWSFDDPEILSLKATYVLDLGLGGIMFWELAGDTRDGELIAAIDEGLHAVP